MKLVFATENDSENLIIFFNNHINKNDFDECYYEYFCPYWLRAAIKRDQVIILKDNETILGALRFYFRKTDNKVSLYQFALDKKVRSKWVLNKMLKFTWYSSFRFQVLKDMKLNDYFKKKNWSLLETDLRFNYWEINI